MERYAYVCVLINREYYPGLCALNYSLRKKAAKYPLHVIVPESAKDELGILITRLGLDMITLPDLQLSAELLESNKNVRWNQTFFKLQIFKLIQFEKIVFLDLDMIVTKNIDDLFEKPHMAAVAAGHCVHRDWIRLNSGLMVVVPDGDFYATLVSSIPDTFNSRLEQGLGVGDQDVINYCFPDWWEHKELILPEVYNGLCSCLDKLCTIFGYQNLRVIHFTDALKPWDFSGWRMCLRIMRSLRMGRFQYARMCARYWWYLMQSCPDYLKYIQY